MPFAIRQVEELRRSLTETCMYSDKDTEYCVRKLAWWSGFLNTARPDGQVAAAGSAKAVA